MKFSLKLPARDKVKSPPLSSEKGKGSLETIWIGVYIALAVSVLLAAFVSYLQISSREGGIQQRQLEERTAGYAAQIAEMVRLTAASMESLVKEPELARLLIEGDQAALQAREQSLSYLFPSSIRVKLLPPGVSEPDHSMTPPLSYACLDMLGRVGSQQQMPKAEIHLSGSPQQHIDFVQTIPGPVGIPAGTLLVTFAVPALQELLAKLPLTQGYVELQQPGPKGDVVIASRGEHALKQGKPSKELEVAGSQWRLLFWGADEVSILTASVTVMYWASFATILLLMAGVMFVLYLALSRLLRQDQVTIIRMIKDLVDDNLAREYPVSLSNCRGTIEQLRKITWDYSTASVEKPYSSRKGNVQTVAIRDSGGAPGKKPRSDYGDDVVVGGLMDTTFMDSALEVEEVFDEGVGESRLPASIFRAYDIRGIAGKTLVPELACDIGHSIGSEAQERGQKKIVVARDGRLSGPQLCEALIRGLRQSGCEVIDIGMVPTPVLYFAAHYMGNGCGVMLTGSHNPPEYNGMKIMLREETLHNESIQELRTRIESGKLLSGDGDVQAIDVVPSYIERVTSDVRLARPLKVVVDCGNGVAGEVAPQLLRALGCDVIELFCEIDGNFPNHHPDPGRPENLIALTRAVSESGADVGLAFDGDGDRLGVVDSEGKIIWPDRLLMLLARDVLTRQPGALIIYDVKSSRHMEADIRGHGGEPLMWKTGHSFLKAKLRETGAQLAGEMSGHIFFSERWFGFDDALYAAARLLEVLSQEAQSSSVVFSEIPESVSTPELNVAMAEGEHFALMDALRASANFPGAHLVTIDGLRVEYEDGWGLVRASNTTPSLTLRFEADNAETLQRIQDDFRQQLLQISPGLQLPF